MAGSSSICPRGGALALARACWRRRRCRTVGHKVPFFAAEEATWRAAIHLTAGRSIEGRLFIVILVDMASGCSRRGLSGCSGCCGWGGNSGHGGHRWGRSPMSSDLLVGFLEILLQEPDLLLHGTDQALHLSVCLLVEYPFYSTSGCYNVFHRFVS